MEMIKNTSICQVKGLRYNLKSIEQLSLKYGKHYRTTVHRPAMTRRSKAVAQRSDSAAQSEPLFLGTNGKCNQKETRNQIVRTFAFAVLCDAVVF